MLYGLALILGVWIGFPQDAANGFEILIGFTGNAINKHAWIRSNLVKGMLLAKLTYSMGSAGYKIKD